MRPVKISGTPPADWIAQADVVTASLRAAVTEDERKQIIKDNETLWRDPRIHQWLLDQFHNKCWYSEAADCVSPDHVDHFRPKGRVKQELGGTTAEGYWWLAFDWRNYRICGHLLNSKKGDLFPISEGERCKPGNEVSLRLEAPILIDPISDQARLISFDIDEDGCVAVLAAKSTAAEEARVEKTIEILGLNARDKLNKKRKTKWDDAMQHIADFVGAQATHGAQCLAMIQQATAKSELRKLVAYEAEFSSVAEACVDKNAPEALRRLVFNP
jgi:hypothetical protein